MGILNGDFEWVFSKGIKMGFLWEFCMGIFNAILNVYLEQGILTGDIKWV